MKLTERISWKNLVILVFFIAITTSNVYAQRIIEGVVTSAERGETLPGVNVVVKNTTRGTTTGIDGKYIIEMQPNDKILEFSFIGYQSQEVEVGDNLVINIILQEEARLLDEFVVIGYGTIRKSDLTGAVSSVRAEDIRKFTSLNPTQALQGKATGVHVTTTSGAPGAGLAVRVRGVGTFNNAAPIFVVDGVILDDISFLSSADIQSMEVLKDASATAIYGSRGANGVILVTTNQGSRGMIRPLVSLHSEYGMQSLTQKIDLLNGREFAIISNEIRPGSYNNVDAVPNIDWQDLIFEVAPMQKHQLAISGGAANSKYYVGINLFQQDGIVPNSNFQRLSLKLNNTYFLGEVVSIGNNITIAPYTQRNAPNVTYSVYRAQPLLNPYYDDGSFGVVYHVGNPLADLAYSNSYNRGLRAVGNVFADLTIMNDFLLRSSFGVDAGYNRATSFTPAFTVYNPDGTASPQDNRFSGLFKGNNQNLSWLWENTITYNKIFSKHSINAMAGYTMQTLRSEFLNMSGKNIMRDESDFWYILPSYIIDEANNINLLQSIGSGVDPNLYYSMISFLARANYTYDNRYILTATFRRDGSSKFAEQNRFGNFPSFAAGWNIHNEKFMQNINFISSLRLRASWGMIGNEKIAYIDRFSRANSNLFAVFANPDMSFPAATYGKSGNPELKWETTTQTDFGLEVGLFNNRFTTELGFYHKVTNDILVELATPGHLGNGQGQRVRYNAASVLNQGFEFNLRWRETLTPDFSYTIGVLGTTIRNDVWAVGGASGIDSVLIGGFLGNGQPVTLSRVGLPIGAFYGYVTDGIFQNQAELDAYPHMSLAGVGDLRFVDTNNDGRINALDRTYLGSPIPKFIFGLSMEMTYRAFDFSLDIQGQTGNKIFNGKDVVRPDPYNFEKYVFDRWSGEGTSNTIPRASFGGYNYTPSDFFVKDGSFLRLRNVIIGYTLPERLSSRFRLAQVRLYIKGTNLYTLTHYSGYTPEIGGFDVLSNGIDHGVYPIAGVYSVGININF